MLDDLDLALSGATCPACLHAMHPDDSSRHPYWLCLHCGVTAISL